MQVEKSELWVKNTKQEKRVDEGRTRQIQKL